MSAYLFNRSKLSLEAGIKYLVLAAASAAFLLFGMALIYAQLGTLQFGQIAAMLISGLSYQKSLIYPGMALIITGIGFKLAVVPFHMWTPDVYEGAPAPVTAFVATVSKGGMVALLLRYFYETGAYRLHPVFVVFSIIAIASMIAGNLLALLQKNVKRILAYSSIAHLGYILVAFLAGGNRAAEAVTFYLVAYFITTLGAFGVVTVLSNGDRDADSLEDYEGLFWRRPGWYFHPHVAVAGRNSTDRRFRREILPCCRRNFGVLVDPDLRPHRHQRRRSLLLPARPGGPVQGSG
jgi:NADH-quinone oxidoreductase subunit N